MNGVTVPLIPATCSLCSRPFIKSRAVRCTKCDAIVCRDTDRACLALHQAERHAS